MSASVKKPKVRIELFGNTWYVLYVKRPKFHRQFVKTFPGVTAYEAIKKWVTRNPNLELAT